MKRNECFQTYSMRPVLPRYKSQKRYYKRRKLQTNIPEQKCKNSQQNISKPNSIIHKNIIYYDQMGLILEEQGQLNIHKLTKVIHHVNKTKDKNHVIISLDTEKALDKIHQPFMIKIFQQCRYK